MSQTVVAEQGRGFEGQLQDLGNTDINSYLAEGVVPFGRYCELGTDPDRQAKLVAAATGITDPKKRAGVAVRTHTIVNPLSGNAGEYADKSAVSLLTKGRCLVKMNGAFTPDTVVHVGFQNNENGQFFAANTADRDILADARVKNSGADGELAILDLSLT